MITRKNLIDYYRSRWDFHLARSQDEALLDDARAHSAKKARSYRGEMFRWKFLPEDVFEAIADGVTVEEPVEQPLWHIIVFFNEHDSTVVVEYEDIPDTDLPALLGSIREKMRVSHVGDEPDENYTPDNEISITPVFEEEDL
jgi:hypothetical protein